MGTFSVNTEIGNPEGTSFETLEALVDTGASFSWVPREFLERLGVQAQERWEFDLANGQIIEK